MVSKSELENAFAVLNPIKVEVVDTSSGCGECFEVVIVSEKFEGLKTLQRHRLVNETGKELISKLHAFSVKTFTKKEYEK
ncbi:hypothetical protein HDU92_007058 [Lobulomyces angularis]|nr:hypothetical protein HDU92_007058 [Lobulomyces angularis]